MTNEAIEELLDQWEEAFESGRDIPPEELCKDRPDLVHEVGRRIQSLKSTVWLNREKQVEEIAPPLEGSTSEPKTLGRYSLQELWASGGFGEVWKALDPALNRIVAVKLPLGNRSTTTEQWQRFLEEARKVASLRHPNIVSVFDIGNDSDRPFIVSEFVNGPNFQIWRTEQKPSTLR